METAKICPSCNTMALEPVCPSCHTLIEEPAEAFAMSIHIAVAECGECELPFGLDEPNCPVCAEPNDAQADPQSFGLNAVRLNALSGLVQKYRAAGRSDENSAAARLTLTGEQFITLLVSSEHGISADLIGRPKALVQDLRLDDEEAMRAPATAEALRALTACASANVQQLQELDSVDVPEEMLPLRALMVALRQAIGDLHDAIADGLLVCTPNEAIAAQLHLQHALDAGEEAGDAISSELESIDVGKLTPSLSERLSVLTRQPGTYEHRGALDLAAVYADVTVTNLSHDERVVRVASSFRGIIPLDALTSADEADLDTLLFHAAEIHASPSPVAFVRRLAPLVEILKEAFLRYPSEITAAVTEAVDESEDALVALLSATDVITQATDSELDRSSRRLFLSQAYGTLSDWVFRRLINVTLAGKFCIDGRPEPFATTAARPFGDKLHILEQSRDARYAVALVGVAKVIRNAGAHGDVDLSGEEITFREVDRKGRETIERLTDEQFVEKLSDLLTTCQALSMAVEVFRFLKQSSLPAPSIPSRPRLQAQAVRALLGRWDLSQVEISQAPDLHLVSARTTGLPRSAEDLLPAAAVAAALLTGAPSSRLVVSDQAGEQQAIEVGHEDARRFLEVDDLARPYAVLLTWGRARFDPPVQRDYRRNPISAFARLLTLDVSRLSVDGQLLPASRADYERRRAALLQGCGIAKELLDSQTAPSKFDVILRKQLLRAIRTLTEGLSRTPATLNRATRQLEPLTRAADEGAE